MTLSKKEKRAFQRLVSGLTIGCHQGAYYRFMTLTTAPGIHQKIQVGKKKKQLVDRLNWDFDILKKRIFRAKYGRDGFSGFKFNKYFKLRTAEGNGVLHIIYWGRFIPQWWLSKTWKQIHDSPVVDIRAAYGKRGQNVKGLVGYLLTNYLTKQPIERMSYGWKWAWLGLAKSWDHVRKTQQFVKRSASLKAKATWAENNIQNSTRTYYVPLCKFKDKYRNCTLEVWNSLLKNPLSTSRQTKLAKKQPETTRKDPEKQQQSKTRQWFFMCNKTVEGKTRISLVNQSLSSMRWKAALPNWETLSDDWTRELQ